MNKSTLSFLVLFLCICFCMENDCVSHFQINSPADTITGESILEHVRFLASDDLEGRETFSKGQYDAAGYISGEFEKRDLKPVTAGEDYYQVFEMDYTEVLSPNSLQINGKSYVDGYDFRVAAVGGGRIEKEVVFIGYGISTTSYDSYADVDVRDKIVLVFQGKLYKRGPEWGIAPLHIMRVLYALEHGAAGMIFVEGTAPKDHKRPIPSRFTANFVEVMSPMIQKLGLGIWGEETWERWHRFPLVYVTAEVGNDLLAPTGKTIFEAKEEIDRRGKPRSFPLGRTAMISAKVIHGPRKTMNVMGLVGGVDPHLKDEVVVVCAHYDHLGVNSSGEIFYGADDNASGTAALIELAGALAECPKKPKRSVLFIAFTGEEMGGLGSQHYVQQPVIPLSRTVAVFNMDMIGRNDPEEIGVLCGGEGQDDLFRVNQEMGAAAGIQIQELTKGYSTSSDHGIFFQKKVPFVFYYDEGGDFAHTPEDTWNKLSSAKMERVARLCFLAVCSVADQAEGP